MSDLGKEMISNGLEQLRNLLAATADQSAECAFHGSDKHGCIAYTGEAPCESAAPLVDDGTERARFERAFIVQEGVFYSSDRKEYLSMNGRSIEKTDSIDLNLRLSGWMAHAALAAPAHPPAPVAKSGEPDQRAAHLPQLNARVIVSKGHGTVVGYDYSVPGAILVEVDGDGSELTTLWKYESQEHPQGMELAQTTPITKADSHE
jgi:hypothetical protein